MSNFIYTAGLHNVGSYQVSGHPFVTGSTIKDAGNGPTEHRIDFPYVTKSVVVKNYKTSGTKKIEVRFVSTSSMTTDLHHISIPPDSFVTLNVKCTSIFLTTDNQAQTGQYEVYASLTSIPAARMYELTGSGISE
jgi:hypothetical protein